jgi:lipopolysaccharide export system permease protein
LNRIARMVARMIVMRFIPILLGLTIFVLTLEIVTYVKEILAQGEGQWSFVGTYAFTRAPATLATFVPISLLLALLLTMTELSYRNETTAIWSVGLSPARLIVMLMPFALLIGALHFLLVDRLVPATSPTLRAWAIGDYGEKRIRVGERDPIWLRSGSDILRAAISNPASTLLSDVVIFRRDDAGNLLEQIFAEEASLGTGGWTLKKVTIYGRDSALPKKLPDMVYAGTMRAAKAGSRSGDPEEMTIGDLSYFVANEGFGIRPTHVYQTWWHKRVSLIFVSLIMVALVIPLTVRFRRGGGLGVLFTLGIGMGFTFFILDGVALSVGELGFVFPWLAAWLPVLVFGSVALYLLGKTERV